MMVNIELKNDPGEQGFDPSEATAVAVAHLLAESGWWERVVVSSFRSASIDALRAVDDRPPIAGSSGSWPTPRQRSMRRSTAATTPCTPS